MVARKDLAEFLIRLEGTTKSPRTLFLSRLIGLYCILVALSMITRRQATLESVTALLHDPSMIFIVGVIALAAGLAMVLAHNIWSGGALVVIVTLVGWITLIKSLFFLFLPTEVEAGVFPSAASLPRTFLPVRSYLTRPRHLPDLWRIQVNITNCLSGVTMPNPLAAQFKAQAREWESGSAATFEEQLTSTTGTFL
jgi:hypothetical protein